MIERQAEVLSACSATLRAQAEAMVKLMDPLEVLEWRASGPRVVSSYSGAVRQQTWQPQVLAVGQQYACSVCAGPHMKRECPQFVGTQQFEMDKPFWDTGGAQPDIDKK